MKKLLLLFIGSLTGTAIMAQEVISSGGETQTTSGYEICWTLGEPVIETFMPGTHILTQGVQQSRLTATPISEILYNGIEVKVFPNPALDFINIQFNELAENPSYSLYDIDGRLIEKKQITSTSTQLNLQKYAKGQYILHLTTKSGKPVQSIKIVKQ